MEYGYEPDTKHLWGWDGEFRYQGTTDTPPENASEVFKEVAPSVRMSGSYFLSGQRTPVMNTWIDSEEATVVMTNYKKKQKNNKNEVGIRHNILSDITGIVGRIPWCISGPVCRNPDQLAEFCQAYPTVGIYVCPVIDELAAFGRLASDVDESPRRAPIHHPRLDELPNTEFQEFAPELEGDGFGRMADLVNNGVLVVNEMMNTLGVMPFYGNMLLQGEMFGDEVFIVRSQSMDGYFPEEPISIKMYAATTVPVSMKVTDAFRESTGTKRDFVPVMVVSDHVPGLSTFMRFYLLMSGKDFFCVETDKEKFPEGCPLFRYNKGYMFKDKGQLGEFRKLI